MNRDEPSEISVFRFIHMDLKAINDEVVKLIEPCGDARMVATMIDNVFDSLHYGNVTTTQAGAYIEVLNEVPHDLIALARSRIIATHKWPTPPKPADFMETIAPELLDRRCAEFRAGWLLEHKEYVAQFNERVGVKHV